MESKKMNKEDDFMPTAIIMTPTEKTTLKNTRTSLDAIRKKAQERKKNYSCETYDAKEENEFFKMVESTIYKKIVSDDE